MKRICPKPRIRFDAESYKTLHRQILERDGWRCQNCGSPRNLQVHHQQFRSQQGADSEQNLITLCANCHASLHLGERHQREDVCKER